MFITRAINCHYQVWLIRHGSSQMAGSGRWQGWTDTPLSQDGERQARACFVSGALPEVATVYSSPLRRCTESAKIIKPQAQIILDNRLRTRHLGKWEGWTTEDIIRDGGEWFSPFAEGSPPGGESLEGLRARISDFLDELRLGQLESYVVVTHGAVIGTVLLSLGERPVIVPPCSHVVVGRSKHAFKLLKGPSGSVSPV